MSSTYDIVSSLAKKKLEEFSDAFATAIASQDVTPWAASLGHSEETDALKVTYPITLDAAGYKEFSGEIKYRTLYARWVSLTHKQWQDGVKEKKRVIEASDFLGWGKQPAIMAEAAQQLPNVMVASMLAANPNLGIYQDPENSANSVTKALFASDHPYDLTKPSGGTFDNDLTAEAVDSTLMATLRQHFRSLMGPGDATNRRNLGLRLTHLLVPPQLEEAARTILDSDTIVIDGESQTNIYKGSVELVVGDELTGDYVYGLALNKPGLVPWVVLTSGAPEEIIQDESDNLYKTSLQVAIAFILDANVAAMFPQPIVRVEITGPEEP